MKKWIMCSAFLVVICCSGASYALDQEWSLVLEEKDIRVYAREFPDSVLREYRAETTLDADILSVSAVLDDIPAAVEWFPFCIFAGVVEELADGRKIIMNISDFPWPFQDRYAVFSSRKVRDYSQKRVVIDFEIDDLSKVRAVDGVVNTDDMVKLTFMKGQWALLMIDRDKTKVIYTICADAGGHVPLWLIKTFFEGTPYKTLKNLRHFVKRPKYQEISVPDEDRQGFGLF